MAFGLKFADCRKVTHKFQMKMFNMYKGFVCSYVLLGVCVWKVCFKLWLKHMANLLDIKVIYMIIIIIVVLEWLLGSCSCIVINLSS